MANEITVAYAGQVKDTVFVVDDDPLVRDSLEIVLSFAGLRVVKFAAAQHFLSQITRDQSGCVLTDIRMPGMDGLELQEALSGINAMMTVIVMTGHADVPLAVRAMKAGALDILEKPFKNELLIERVQAALALARQKAELLSNKKALEKRYNGLSDREREIFALVAAGHSSKEIGRQLDISPRTVENHRAHLMKKMRAENLTALIRMSAAIL
jgi:two-component system response regulator FixJ